MRILHDPIRSHNPRAIYCYIDTVELFFRYPPKGFGKIRTMLGRRAMLEPCRDRHGFTWGYRLIAHQPTREAISELDRLQKKYKAPLCRLDVAADFIFPNSDARRTFKAWLTRSVLLRWRPCGPMYDEDDTTCWVSYSERTRLGKKRSRRDLALYADKPCKVTGELDCVHIELRLMKAAAIRNSGYGRVRSLDKLDPCRLLQKHIKLVDFDPEAFKQKLARAAVNDDRRFYRGKTTTPFVDRYRASIPRRVRGFIERFTQDRAQLVKEFFGMEMQSVGLDVLRLPNQLEWS